MKLILVLAGLVLLTFTAKSQANYEILSLGTTYTEADIQNAFSTADFCGSHYQNQRFLIVFDDGAQVELLSASELPHLSAGCILSDNAIIPSCTHSVANGIVNRQCTYSNRPKEELHQNSSNN